MTAIDEALRDQEWSLCYRFWRGQYTARNRESQDINLRIALKLEELLEKNNGNTEWLHWLATHRGRDPREYTSNFPQGCLITAEEIDEYVKLELQHRRKFPYWRWKDDPMLIIQTISEGKFPPTQYIQQDIGGGAYPAMKDLCCGHRVASVHSIGKDNEENEILTIDCGAEISVILEEVAVFIEKKKNIYAFDYYKNSFFSAYRKELCDAGSKFRVGSNETRAIGLLIYDYANAENCTDTEAIDWANEELSVRGPRNFGAIRNRKRQAHDWLANTRNCIDFAEVLEMT